MIMMNVSTRTVGWLLCSSLLLLLLGGNNSSSSITNSVGIQVVSASNNEYEVAATATATAAVADNEVSSSSSSFLRQNNNNNNNYNNNRGLQQGGFDPSAFAPAPAPTPAAGASPGVVVPVSGTTTVTTTGVTTSVTAEGGGGGGDGVVPDSALFPVTQPPLPVCLPVGIEPFQTTVYTAVTYSGPDFDFNNISQLVQLEGAYQDAYNSFNTTSCWGRYSNAFKTMGVTFVLSADLQKKRFLIGSRVRTNAVPNTCKSGGTSVPQLYESTNRTQLNNGGPKVNPLDVGNCNCVGPWNKTLIVDFNTNLQLGGVNLTGIKKTQVITYLEQLCVNDNCTAVDKVLPAGTYTVFFQFLFLCCCYFR